MKNNEIVLKELRIERNFVNNQIEKIYNLKYNNTEEFMKLGAMMCQLLDTQYKILESYKEILTARIILLEVDLDD